MQHIFKRHRQLSHTVPDAVYECVRHHFTEAELVNLTLASVECSALSQRLRNLDVDRFQAGA
jgi:hypothetical protein